VLGKGLPRLYQLDLDNYTTPAIYSDKQTLNRF
jgi:hypothetical protein